MIFRPDLAEKVAAGEKSVTRRLASRNPRSPWWVGRCQYVDGREYAVQPGRGKHRIATIRVVSVQLEAWTAGISDREAHLEGFGSAEDFKRAFYAINGEVPTGQWIWRLAFRVVPAAGLAGGTLSVP